MSRAGGPGELMENRPVLRRRTAPRGPPIAASRASANRCAPRRDGCADHAAPAQAAFVVILVHPAVSMFEDRTYKRTFYSAPQSVTSFVAAFLEPTITVATFLIATLYYDELIDRPALTLCLLVFALTFPGRNRFRDNLIAAGVDIVSSWVTLVAILALCGYATRSLHYFENSVLLYWFFITPVLQWAAVWG